MQGLPGILCPGTLRFDNSIMIYKRLQCLYWFFYALVVYFTACTF
nr:MAG TPA: hypothetical protein [Caudoviricetes sp.]